MFTKHTAWTKTLNQGICRVLKIKCKS